MPSPIGHALGGAIVYSLFDRQKRSAWWLVLITLFFAELPDIDFLFGFPSGNPNKYHHHFTHSFFFVILIGVLAAWIFSKLKVMHFGTSAVLFTVAGVSHIILDLLCVDTSYPYGAPVLWPFSETYFISPIRIFSDMQRASNSAHFFSSMLNAHNLVTISIEILILAPMIPVIRFLKKKRDEQQKE